MSKVKQALYVVGLLMWFAQALANEKEAELPSMELLEFLGDAENIDGEWLDPLDMIDLQEAEQQTRQQERNEND